MDPRENPGIQQSSLNGLQQFVVRIPPARVSVFFSTSIGQKRSQRDGGIAGLGNPRKNRNLDRGLALDSPTTSN